MPLLRHLATGVVRGMPGLWRRLGNLESAFLRDRLQDISIRQPVWVAGLARAGSTILLEVLASLPTVATHQYRDFPMLHVPYWWRTFLGRAVRGEAPPSERAHGDRIEVTASSPEAMEEVIWSTFFHHLHDPDRENVLDRRTANPEFERFFRDHIRKLLLVEGVERYVAKGNYNLTRLPYLLSHFPDARFVVPIRRPVDHVASLMKQHRLFTEGTRAHPRSVAHLDRVGHYEFGANRTPVNAGADTHVGISAVRRDWAEGREVRGWARYWAHLYGWLRARLDAEHDLLDATLVVRYEDLCVDTGQVLRRILEHTGFEQHADEVLGRFEDTISAPTYYAPDFTDDELDTLRAATSEVAAKFGYEG